MRVLAGIVGTLAATLVAHTVMSQSVPGVLRRVDHLVYAVPEASGPCAYAGPASRMTPNRSERIVFIAG